MSRLVLGIDFGTTNSCVGCVLSSDNANHVVLNGQGNPTTPSFISHAGEDYICGELSYNRRVQQGESTVYAFKRLLGKRWADRELHEALGYLPFEVTEDVSGNPQINLGGRYWTAEDLTALYLKHLYTVALKRLESSVQDSDVPKDCVITCPARFDVRQRQVLSDAYRVAGLNPIQVINEPTAAAYYYLHKNPDIENRTLLVFDLGGGTLDVTVIKIENSVPHEIATDGHSKLGGEDFDNVLLDWAFDEIEEEFVEQNANRHVFKPKELLRLKDALQQAKHQLSDTSLDETNIEIASFIKGEDLELELSRDEFDELVSPLVDQCMEKISSVLHTAKLTKDDIDDVILVGGGSRVPLIRSRITDFFGREPLRNLNEDTIVAEGAAWVGRTKIDDPNPGPTPTTILGLALGTDNESGVIHYFGKTDLEGNPTKLPIERTLTFTNVIDNARSISVRIYQGICNDDDQRILQPSGTKCRGVCQSGGNHNRLIDQFEVPIPQSAARTERVKVTFSIDTQGFLTIMTTVKSTGAVRTVSFNYNLSQEQIAEKAGEERFNMCIDQVLCDE
ncbi:hypothetical protein P9112_000527 [Eukaryota sp. TZLM1-RC]